MYCIVNDNGKLDVYAQCSDRCHKCKNTHKCPLIVALRDEFVVMRYSDISIKDCCFFKRRLF